MEKILIYTHHLGLLREINKFMDANSVVRDIWAKFRPLHLQINSCLKHVFSFVLDKALRAHGHIVLSLQPQEVRRAEIGHPVKEKWAHPGTWLLTPEFAMSELPDLVPCQCMKQISQILKKLDALGLCF